MQQTEKPIDQNVSPMNVTCFLVTKVIGIKLIVLSQLFYMDKRSQKYASVEKFVGSDIRQTGKWL